MKSKFKAKHKIITPQLNKQKSQKNSPLCTVYSPLCTQCTPNKVKNISNNINIVIWNNIEGHQTQFRFFEQNFKKSVKSLHVISYFDSTNCLQATCCLPTNSTSYTLYVFVHQDYYVLPPTENKEMKLFKSQVWTGQPV